MFTLSLPASSELEIDKSIQTTSSGKMSARKDFTYCMLGPSTKTSHPSPKLMSMLKSDIIK